jgi:delta-aminolevulinic acid dehydratase/porphobilinogen synthase
VMALIWETMWQIQPGVGQRALDRCPPRTENYQSGADGSWWPRGVFSTDIIYDLHQEIKSPQIVYCTSGTYIMVKLLDSSCTKSLLMWRQKLVPKCQICGMKRPRPDLKSDFIGLATSATLF